LLLYAFADNKQMKAILLREAAMQLVFARQACSAHGAKGEPLETIWQLGFGD